MSPMTTHSYFVCLSSKCIKKWEDFYAAHQRGIFRAWNRVCVAYLPVWPEGRRQVKHTISAGFALQAYTWWLFSCSLSSTLPSGAPLEEQYWSFVLEKASQSGTKHGKWAKCLWPTHKSTQDQVVSTQIQPQTFSVALQMHELAPEDIFQLSVVIHSWLPSASSNKLHCSDESVIIPMIS